MKNKINKKGESEFGNGVAISFVMCLLLVGSIFWLFDNMNKRQELEDKFSMSCSSRQVKDIDCFKVDVSNSTTTPKYEKRCYFTCYDGFAVMRKR